jgi:DNA-binding GntR family transcriptional regulator
MVQSDVRIEQLAPAPSLQERVYRELERLMVDGALKPGFHLVEDDLASRLGVSRNPIREALQRLASEGFVDRQPGRGAFVRSPGAHEIDEVFHVRTLLESESARLAAERISPAELEELAHILDLGDAAVRNGDASQLLELNERFHGIIVSAADNSVMAKMMVSLRLRIRWYFSAVVVTRSAGSWDQHAEIYRALRDGDGEKAAARMAEHVRQTAQTIRDRRGPSEPETA